MKNTILIVGTLLVLTTCGIDKNKSVARQWIGKKIVFPTGLTCTKINDSTAFECSKMLSADYKIMVFIDSTGCSSCKFRIFDWLQIMAEADSIYSDKVSFLFFIPSNRDKELLELLARAKWKCPVFIDNNNQLDELNHFNRNPYYQTLLLDHDNYVVSIGNPTYKISIWNLYKNLINSGITIKKIKK